MVSVKAKWVGLQEWVRFEDLWQKEVVTKTIEEIEKTAMRIERDSKMIVPVLTGDLRKSITTEMSKRGYYVSAEIGTDLVYSRAVEFGSYNQSPQPYLLPSFDKNVSGLEQALNTILRG